MVAFLDYLPRGSTLSNAEWKVRHTFLQWLLLAHLPALLAFGVWRGYAPGQSIEAIVAPAAFLGLSHVLQSRRLAGLAATAGLCTCSVVLVVLSGGAIEAHFHFFIMIGFIALYQDWVPFVWNAGFTTFSHGIGSWLMPNSFFSHLAGRNDPWTWAVIHGISVLAACAGVMLLLHFTEDDHKRTVALRAELVEGNRRRFTADLLVNLARRNQNLIYRQLELLNQLEDHERDAEQLSHLFQLDHLATRIRRNAESLLVLSGEEPARKWGGSVLLVDVVRAAIAEIEELDRVDFSVDESLQVSGRAVADATHLLAELIENAVHFSPPGLSVMIRTRPYLPSPGAQVLTIEDWGVGMSATDLADANDLLQRPRDVDLATSHRLGLHVVSRLAARYGIVGSLESTPGGGVTAVVVLPAELFTEAAESRTPVGAAAAGASWKARASGFGEAGYQDAAPSSLSAGGHAGLNGSGLNGSGLNGSGLNGSGLNGSGLDSAGPNGSGLNGSGLNGSGYDASGFNGSGLNGTGHDASGFNGSGLNGSGHDASGLNGSGTNGSGLNGVGLAGAGFDGPGLAESGLAGPGLGGSGLSADDFDPGWLGGDDGAGHGATAAGLSGPGRIGRRPASAVDGTGLADPGLDSTGRTGPRADGLDATGGPGLEERRVPGAAMGGATAAPATSGLPAPRVDPAPGRDDSWSSWWPLPTGGTDLAAPQGGGASSLSDASLTRRTPQANLADELRRDEQAAAQRPARPRRDPTETRSALSRFQATQRAAREDATRKPGTDGEARP